MFRIASISKTITAVGIMRLVQDGKLSLEDKVFGSQGNDSYPPIKKMINKRGIFNNEYQQICNYKIYHKIFLALHPLPVINLKHVTLKRVTCNSFPWNKAGDFRTPMLWPNVDKSLKRHTRENA